MLSAANFPLPIDGKFCPDNPRRFKLDSDFVYDDPEAGIKVVVPARFITDFNSSPRLLWWYFAPTDYPEAGLVHDWLYQHPDSFQRYYIKYYQEPYTPIVPLTRQECDAVHRRILELKGMRLTKRQLAYGTLRAAAWRPWNKYRKNDVNSH